MKALRVICYIVGAATFLGMVAFTTVPMVTLALTYSGGVLVGMTTTSNPWSKS